MTTDATPMISTTILLITHDDGIAATAKRVVRLSDGRIIADHPQEGDWE